VLAPVDPDGGGRFSRVWLLIPEGFYSIVEKPGDADLCARARDRGDLDRLREAYMPALGPTTETPGRDYRYRAWISREALAEGLAAVARGLSYSNFRSEVGGRDRERAHLYSRVWSTLGAIQPGGPYGTQPS
jgi:hypothetical protein